MPDFTGVEDTSKKQRTWEVINEDSVVNLRVLIALGREGRQDTQAMARKVREDEMQKLERQMKTLRLPSNSNHQDGGKSKETIQQLCAKSALDRLVQKQKSAEVRTDATQHQASAKRPRSPSPPPSTYIQQILALNPVCLPCTQCY